MLMERTISGTRHTSPATRTEGKGAVAGTTEAISRTGSLQPLKPHQVNLLPEGATITDARLFFTKQDIQTALQDGTPADEFTFDGRTWVVHEVNDLQTGNRLRTAHNYAVLVAKGAKA